MNLRRSEKKMTQYYTHLGPISQYHRTKNDAIEYAKYMSQSMGAEILIRRNNAKYAYIRAIDGRIENLTEGVMPEGTYFYV